MTYGVSMWSLCQYKKPLNTTVSEESEPAITRIACGKYVAVESYKNR